MTRLLLVFCVLVVVALVGAVSLPYQKWFPVRAATDSSRDTPRVESRGHVKLSAEKFAAAQIEVQSVSRRELRPHRTVPGRIDYNATRHIEVKSPFDGLIRSIDVKVGDQVSEGQIIAVVDSPELGEKRADVLLRKTDYQRAKNEHDWWHAIQSNVDELVARLKRPQEILELSKDFADKPLGDYRQQILSAYSQMRLDDRLSESVSNSKDGTFAPRVKLERESARDTSAAKFTGACEQATFDVKQKHLTFEAAMNDAEQRLAIAKQRLGLLVNQPQEQLPDVGGEESLSTWPVKAPFTGTVEEVLLAPKERIQMSQGLFQLADTSHLWVQADIRERDWSALSVAAGQKISVQTPAFPGKSMEATVTFIGRAVAIETRAVPVTADIDNASGLLRPGMFVRVLMPDGEPHECLAVPQSSIVTNDGRTFVFMETGPREFDLRDVKTGQSVDPWIEILSGLELGDHVVTSGTAILKAEFLLEPDE